MKGGTPSTRRLFSILASCNLRLGMSDAQAIEHARGTCQILATKFPRTSLYIATAEVREVERQRRDAAIVAARREGRSFGWIGRKYRISRGRAHAICKGAGVHFPDERPNSADRDNPEHDKTESRN
jgi:hypothetical protein